MSPDEVSRRSIVVHARTSSTASAPNATARRDHVKSFTSEHSRPTADVESGAQGRIRTSVPRKERQIYSLLPLTTQPPVQNAESRRPSGALHGLLVTRIHKTFPSGHRQRRCRRSKMAQHCRAQSHDSPEKFLMECVENLYCATTARTPRKPPQLPELFSGAGEGI